MAELEDDARSRDQISEVKRRQIVELTALRDRIFTHAKELAERRKRLVEVNAELEQNPMSASAYA